MRFKAFLLFVLMILLFFGCSKKSTEPEDETTVKKPVFLLPSGTYEDGQYIAIRCDTEDAVIRYTLDNSEPLMSSAVYTEELRIPDFFINNSNYCIVKARAFKTGFLPSQIASATYTLNYSTTVATPNISPTGGIQISNLNAIITCATPGAVIRFTTDGTEPSYNSPVYSVPFPVTHQVTIKARAFKSGMNASAVAETSYDLRLYELGFIETPGEAYDVAIRGNYAYVADLMGGLRTYDISDPSQPVETSYSLTSNYARRIAFIGNYALVAAGNGFYVFNLSVPSEPELVLYYMLPDAVMDIVVNGNYAYLACFVSAVRIVDLSNPESPVHVGAINLSGVVSGITYNNNYVYLAALSGGLRIINVTNPSNPVAVGHFPLTATDVAINGNIAYVLDLSTGLKVLNVSNPASPHQIGALNIGSCSNLELESGFAYIISSAGVEVVNIETPAEPVLYARYTAIEEAISLKVSNRYVYVADYPEGLRTLYLNLVGDKLDR